MRLMRVGACRAGRLGRPDHPYLQAGDVVELEIDGLGRQRPPVRRA